MGEIIRLAPKPIIACPPKHRDDARRALAQQFRAYATVMAHLADACSEVGDSAAACDCVAIGEKCNRLAARVEPDDAG